MVKVFGHRLKSILSILLIAVMTTLMLNRLVYVHIHLLPDGTGISHAHPFSKSGAANPESSHQHSDMELFLLDQLDILILVLAAAYLLKPFARFNGVQKPVTEHLLTIPLPLYQGRAPPRCM
jgi:hypothetical protein